MLAGENKRLLIEVVCCACWACTENIQETLHDLRLRYDHACHLISSRLVSRISRFLSLCLDAHARLTNKLKHSRSGLRGGRRRQGKLFSGSVSVNQSVFVSLGGGGIVAFLTQHNTTNPPFSLCSHPQAADRGWAKLYEIDPILCFPRRRRGCGCGCCVSSLSRLLAMHLPVLSFLLLSVAFIN